MSKKIERTESVECPICGKEAVDVTFLLVKDVRGSSTLFHCFECELLFGSTT